jgi:hypothetical protein
MIYLGMAHTESRKRRNGRWEQSPSISQGGHGAISSVGSCLCNLRASVISVVMTKQAEKREG